MKEKMLVRNKHNGKKILLSMLMLLSISVILTACGSKKTGSGANKAYPTSLDHINNDMLSSADITCISEYYETFFSISDGEVHEIKDGIYYDTTTNTLTLENFCNTEARLNVQNMGPDFTLKIEGSCILSSIDVNYGSMRITGDGGTLLLLDKSGRSDLNLRGYDQKHAIMIDDVNVYVSGCLNAFSGLESALYYLEPLKLDDDVYYDPNTGRVEWTDDPGDGTAASGFGFYLQ